MPYEGRIQGSPAPFLDDLIQHVENRVDPAMRVMALEARDQMHDSIARNTPVDTRHLRESLQKEPLRRIVIGGEAVIETGVVTFVDYAPYVEEGTGLWGPKNAKYVIEPKKPGGVLHWITPSGQHVFAKKVMHPGSPGNHMFAIGAAMTEHEFESFTRAALVLFKTTSEAYHA